MTKHVGGKTSPESARKACKKYRQNHPHKILAYARRQKGIPEWGGLSLVGTCVICREAKVLVPDHDHDTKETRGWICGFCNRFLGIYEKVKKTGKLERIESYLKGELYGIIQLSDSVCSEK